jgi:hypothetical protein
MTINLAWRPHTTKIYPLCSTHTGYSLERLGIIRNPPAFIYYQAFTGKSGLTYPMDFKEVLTQYNLRNQMMDLKNTLALVLPGPT